MKFEVLSFSNGERIPDEFAFCIPAEEGHVQLGKNLSPHVRWSDLPQDTKSLVLLCVDPDVPSVPDDVNKDGRTVPADLQRVDFYHWLLVNIPTDIRELIKGQDSNGITAHGKPVGEVGYGVRGINDYTNWFAGDESMEGNYGGYDGPCPPWNDERLHHYHFILYALDLETLGLSGNFTGSDVKNAMNGHILGQAEWVGTYTLNKDLF
jgi:Raf kinase inhibitor-like YbhB/YbcL family protein